MSDSDNKKIVSVDVERIGPDPTLLDLVPAILSVGLCTPNSHRATAVADDGTVAVGYGMSEKSALENATHKALK